jgi:hypothetical protein
MANDPSNGIKFHNSAKSFIYQRLAVEQVCLANLELGGALLSNTGVQDTLYSSLPNLIGATSIYPLKIVLPLAAVMYEVKTMRALFAGQVAF